MESRWDRQAVGRAIGVELGHDIASNVLPAILALQQRCARLETALKLIESFEERAAAIGTARVARIAREARMSAQEAEGTCDKCGGWRDGSRPKCVC